MIFSLADYQLANISNALGSKAMRVTASIIPGFITLEVSMTQLDYAPGGINPPHIHQQATEIVTIIEGTLEVGFVTSNPENRLITKVLPKGMSLYSHKVSSISSGIGNGNAATVSGFDSQSPGIMFVVDIVLGSNPPIASDLLAKAFQVDKSVIAEMQSRF